MTKNYLEEDFEPNRINKNYHEDDFKSETVRNIADFIYGKWTDNSSKESYEYKKFLKLVIKTTKKTARHEFRKLKRKEKKRIKKKYKKNKKLKINGRKRSEIFTDKNRN